MLLEKGAFVVDVDVQATLAAYEKLPLPNCDTNDWRNYVYAVEHAEPEVRQFVRSLGVDLRKPSQMSAYPAVARSMVQYGGSFHLVGEVKQGSPTGALIYDDQQSIMVGDSAVTFSAEPAQAREDFPDATIRMEIFMCLPWVLKA